MKAQRKKQGYSEERRPASAGGAKRDFPIGYYAVCVVDVLGQQEKLRGWEDLPEDGHMSPAFMAALKETAGTIRGLRRGFAEFFSQLEVATLSEKQLDSLSVEQRQAYDRLKECQLSQIQVSDTFISYAPMRNSASDVTTTPLYRMLSACAMMTLWALAGRIAVRGGITIGTGIDMGKEGFYGPALAQAHRLESRCADYPRVIVDGQVIDLLRQGRDFSAHPDVERSIVNLNRSTRQLVHRDSDGLYMVHPLSNGLREISLGVPRSEEMVARAYAFVREEHDRLLLNSPDSRLPGRYAKLLCYFEQFAPAWDLPSLPYT
jgi:hypothetical protein